MVDLALEALEAAGISREHCALLALDPESFNDFSHVLAAPGEPTARFSPRLLKAAGNVLTDLISGGRAGVIARYAENAQGIIAVGGGYLVANSRTRKAGVLLNHMAQLSVASRATCPTIYLPQSIGPLDGVVGRMTKSRLRNIDRLYVRDHRTLAEVGTINTQRCGDLAVMKLAREINNFEPVDTVDDRLILVGRDLPRSGDYISRLRELDRKGRAVWAVQADVSGPRSDRSFYKRIGMPASGNLSDILRDGPSNVVVSVRLHGAIAALLAGRPAIHLAYERKGWGAYEDLGIAEFVHDARTFDPEQVYAQAQSLHVNPTTFWSRIREAAPSLQNQYERLVKDLWQRLHP